MEWQPIETAPKDAKTVIVYCAFSDLVNAAYWGGGLDEQHHEAWYWVWSDPPETDCHPTHWMPLPDPPPKRD
jgi:hypothetical protein